MNRFDLRIRYADVDPMGWVYYAHYLRFFEIGRAEMLRALGRTYAQVETEDGILLPVLEARARYLQGARYDDLVTIETGVLDVARASVRFGYRLVSATGAELALGFTEHCYMTREGRPVRPSAALRALLDQAPRVDGVMGERMRGGS